HSYGGKYAWQAWAYDAKDLVAVKNGKKNPWDLKPYATWNFGFPIPNGEKYMGGVAFDPSSGRLYFSELRQDTTDRYAYAPLIQVFQLSIHRPSHRSSSQVPSPRPRPQR